MTVLYYAADAPFSPRAWDILRGARSLAFGDEEINIEEEQPGVGALNFGHTGLPDGAVRTLSAREMTQVPRAEVIIAAAMRRYQFKPLRNGPIENDAKTLYLDLESFSVKERWAMSPQGYFRLGQWAWGIEGEVFTTESYDDIVDLVRSAECTVAHMGHAFDLSVLFGVNSLEALHMAMADRLFDTKVFAGYNFPAPDWYIDRNGRKRINASKPDQAVHGWLSLDNLCHVFGTPGKEGDLKALAEEFGGFGNIPLDDPRFLAYARQDIGSLQHLTGSLLEFATPDDYDWREQQWAAIQAQISRNGFSVDRKAAEHRVATLGQRKDELLADLKEKYGFPTGGKMPWRTKVGRQAILDLLTDAGIDPHEDEDWPLTKTGNISLGGEALITALEDTPLAETGRDLAELMGQRSLAQLALDNLQPDGKVHPEIHALQRSGRSSVTEPGLTVYNDAEKAYFVAEPGHKIVSVDYSAADARAVVAMSGDEEYAKRFEPGVDAHELTGRGAFGDERYDSDPVLFRDASKPISHGTNYMIGAKKLVKQIKLRTGIVFTVEEGKEMLANFYALYEDVAAWQKATDLEGRSGWVTNLWGRMMPVERGRSYTQGVGLKGQSTTREVIVDALIRMYRADPTLITYVKVPVHDELIFEIPEERLEEVIPEIEVLMKGVVNGVEFPVQVGEPADNWAAATH